MTVWLLTWFWQGTALTLAAALLLKPRRLNATTRHYVWWAVLFAVIWLGVTASPNWGPIPSSESLNPGAEPLIPVQEASPLLISILLGIWAAVTLVNLLRLLPGLRAVDALRDQCRPFPKDIEAQLPLWLEAKGQGRSADLVMCDAVPGATVLGFQRPCIALPSSLVNALDAEEIDQVVLHEYAHVRRRDDWTRLVQVLLQSALWIHPAVAFIGRSLNRQREMACDDWVVSRTGLPKAYARCLAHAAEVRSRVRSVPALVPTLFGVEHDLVRRVHRLLAVKGRTRRRASLAALAAAACAIVALASHLKTVPLVGESVLSVLPRVASLAAPAASLASIRVPDSAFVVQPFALEQTASAQSSAPAPTFALRAPVDQPANTNMREAARPSDGVLVDPHDARELTPSSGTTEPPGQPLAARSFAGAYPEQNTGASSPDSPSVWGAAATPGLAIADAARKTSLGLAGAFSRASVAMVRRF